jgi:hypothetical protein
MSRYYQGGVNGVLRMRKREQGTHHDYSLLEESIARVEDWLAFLEGEMIGHDFPPTTHKKKRKGEEGREGIRGNRYEERRQLAYGRLFRLSHSARASSSSSSGATSWLSRASFLFLLA